LTSLIDVSNQGFRKSLFPANQNANLFHELDCPFVDQSHSDSGYRDSEYRSWANGLTMFALLLNAVRRVLSNPSAESDIQQPDDSISE
jgi:hypothetical protein